MMMTYIQGHHSCCY